MFAVNRRPKDRTPSGLRSPLPPPDDSDLHDVVRHYLEFYSDEFERTRTLVKGRAKIATVTASILAGAVSVVGAMTAAWQAPWLGILTATFAAGISAITAWDELFNHRQLWSQRSKTLSEVQHLRRMFYMRTAGGIDRQGIAIEHAELLESLLTRENVTWVAIPRKTTK